MFATIRKYRDAKSRDEVFKKVEEGLLPILRESDGFINYYAIEFENGDIGSVSVFENRETSDRATERALAWVGENLGGLLPHDPEIFRGKVLFSTEEKARRSSA